MLDGNPQWPETGPNKILPHPNPFMVILRTTISYEWPNTLLLLLLIITAAAEANQLFGWSNDGAGGGGGFILLLLILWLFIFIYNMIRKQQQ